MYTRLQATAPPSPAARDAPQALLPAQVTKTECQPGDSAGMSVGVTENDCPGRVPKPRTAPWLLLGAHVAAKVPSAGPRPLLHLSD